MFWTIVTSRDEIWVTKYGVLLLYGWLPQPLSIYISFHIYAGTYSLNCDQNNLGKLERSNLLLSLLTSRWSDTYYTWFYWEIITSSLFPPTPKKIRRNYYKYFNWQMKIWSRAQSWRVIASQHFYPLHVLVSQPLYLHVYTSLQRTFSVQRINIFRRQLKLGFSIH